MEKYDLMRHIEPHETVKALLTKRLKRAKKVEEDIEWIPENESVESAPELIKVRTLPQRNLLPIEKALLAKRSRD